MTEKQWKKCLSNPVIRPELGTWKNDRCSSVSVVFREGTCFLYHDGGFGSWWNGVPGHSSIGLLTCSENEFDGKTFTPFLDNPILTWGRFCDFDRVGLQSPRVCLIENEFYLYYIGTSYTAFTPGSCPLWTYDIGLATSRDGISFTKMSHEPIVKRRPTERHGTPHVFFHEGAWRLLTCRHDTSSSKGFEVVLTTSEDPTRWDATQAETVFSPAGPGTWDGFTIAAPAVCYDPDDGCYYMLYGGCESHLDYPEAVGLAHSRDLRHWERHPANPVIRRGRPGEWDDGAIWITAFFKRRATYYAYYEGRSAGRDRDEAYSPGATKQIGLLTHTGRLWGD
jgi:hypothetical protein